MKIPESWISTKFLGQKIILGNISKKWGKYEIADFYVLEHFSAWVKKFCLSCTVHVNSLDHSLDHLKDNLMQKA
jgi:hypothetical protein